MYWPVAVTSPRKKLRASVEASCMSPTRPPVRSPPSTVAPMAEHPLTVEAPVIRPTRVPV